MGFATIEDIVVIENKLSSSTALSPNQISALQSNSYTVRSVSVTSNTNPNIVLTQDKILNFASTRQWYKVTSEGAGG